MSSSRKVVVTGANGQLGTAFHLLGLDATFLSRGDLDLRYPHTVAPLIHSIRPDLVINCAGFTNVDAAESHEDEATVVNGASVGELASVTASLAIPFVTYSTDYVFSGDSPRPYVEGDEVGPLNAYGRSKLVGERLALSISPQSLVIRTSWVVSKTHDNFVATMLRLAADPSAQLQVVNDQKGRPTVASDLARATLDAVAANITGVAHLANQGATTWFDLARFAIDQAGLPGSLSACATDENPRPAARPSNSVLNTERPDLPTMPRWEHSMPAVVDGQIRRLAGGV